MADELWDTLRRRGLTPFAPIFVQCRVLAIAEIPLQAHTLIGAGIPAWAIELAAQGPTGGGEHPPDVQDQQQTGRADLPRQPRLRKASMQAALEAARPENRSRALNELDQDTLAATTMASNNSRVRFYEAVCRTWGLEAWPLSRESVRAFGACLKAGAYRSVAVYFSALIGHQVRTMWQAPSPELRRCIHDTKRAVMRGAGPAHLKDSFHVPVLRKFLQEHGERDSYDAGLPTHMADTLLICCWWMLREIEAANAQVGHVSLNEDKGEVTLLLPVQKCDTRGMLCCRTLRCACRVARHVSFS